MNNATAREKNSKGKASTPYIVGIGASAGGLEAINAFFEQVPENSGLSFVLIQHLSPDYKSMMPELLAKHTSLKISKTTNNTIIRPNCIYTIPADKNINLSGGKLYLEERAGLKTLNLPINVFFKSLAEDMGEKAVAIVLSGTGSDGMLGIEAIKQHGGMVIAQDPHSAAFDSMPKSAIGTGLVDFILTPSRMPDAIINYIENPILESGEGNHGLANALDNSPIIRILNLIHKKTNMDFRQYKKSTIGRRIERRMNMRGVPNLESYLTYLKDYPEEIDLLCQEMLIGVTAFFRDKKAFDVLDEEALETMVKNASRELRIWVSACSTGQEAYSIAILLREQFAKQKKNLAVKIFATDIDQDAIDFASKGIYPSVMMEAVPSDYLSKYFTMLDGKYQVTKDIREMVIFARHDITKDPPFNNINLATCRNLLIYLEPIVQEKILSFIHFSLNEKGFLFLGSSENTGSYSRVFEEVNKKYKIFRNTSSVRIGEIHKLYPLDRKHRMGNAEDGGEKGSEQILHGISESKIVNNFKDALLDDLVPPTAIINDNNDVVHVAGEIDKFIKLPRKQLTLNVLKMVDERLYVSLSNTISKAKKENGKTISPYITLQKESSFLKIVVKPYYEPISRIRYFIISFIESLYSEHPSAIYHETDSEKSDFHREKDAYIKRLEEDLGETKEYLQTTIEELETSNEELQSTNEELMAANEELQSSNEELQSVNEELYTVNNEFQDKLDEMTGLNDDLNNFIQSTNIGTLFLDNDFCLRRFTNEISPYIKVTQADIGRYIGDFTHTFLALEIIEVAKRVLENFVPIEQEVITLDDQVFLMRATLYKTAKKEVKGVIFTFIDITKLKEIEQALNKQTKELERSNRELEQFAYVASHDLKAPITNLVALLDALKGQDAIKEEGNELFQRLYKTISNMNNTIRTLNEVIALKKNMDLRPEHLNIEKVLENVLRNVNEQISKSNTTITTDFSENNMVYFPEIHLQNILQNLITNAIKYHRPQIPPVIHIASHKGKEICIMVSDNGRGIDVEAYKGKLFGLFQRFHLDKEGKGIGLHVTKSILENYGGRIEVESTIDKGAVFKCYFPNVG